MTEILDIVCKGTVVIGPRHAATTGSDVAL
ncbi:MAG: hypothetical protein JWP40_4542 [Blastococcus sp.]|jgi:hypothetical protein|nr:hypothetical protein [Blastococcus sp.]